MYGAWHKQTGWGYLVRERNPYPRADYESILVPIFSLYSVDVMQPGDTHLLVQLIEYHDADPLEFLVESVIKPIIESWSEVVQKRGILLDAHAQNTLLELDNKFIPRRVIHRDSEGREIDAGIRRAKGLPILFPYYVMQPEDQKNKAIYSNVYDYQIGHHSLNFLATTLEQYFQVPIEHVREEARRIFHKSFPDSADYLPPTVFQYSSQPQVDEKEQFVDTGKTPEWR